MKRYKVQSSKIPGLHLIFEYGFDGIFTSLACQGELKVTDIIDVSISVYLNEAKFVGYCNANKIKYQLLPSDISFQAFWDAYDHKERSSKKKSEAIWNRLPEYKRARAIAYIGRYNSQLASTGTSKKYAETYLTSEIFNQ